ncbi:MAG TPA: histidine kinase [Jatrophihabitans sp.]|nr:histidine kinase [Jatrophihabitans sp.]
MSKGPGPRAGVSYARLVPGSLLPPEDPAAGQPRRTVRDWLVDVFAFLVAIVIGLLAYFDSVSSAVGSVDPRLLGLDLVLGALAMIAVWWRRRWPLHLAVASAVMSLVSGAAAGAAVVGMFTVAVHRRTPVALGVAALNLVTGVAFTALRPQYQRLWVTLLINLACVAVLTAWGMFVRARRQLIWTLRARAERAEAEQRLRAEQARRAERTRIAREMHDVLAHRISLLALHAGGLEVRPDLPSEQVQETAALLRTTAHQALEELRGVIGVLRDDGEDAPAQPQPRLTDIPRLVEETRRAGTKIDFELAVPDSAEPPEPLGRDAYRIVQEALTNVAKHARGTATTVRVSGAPGSGLAVVVRNRLPVGTPAQRLPGSGSGLLGLQERVGLAGGTISSGPVGDEFVVEAVLAWA